VGAGLIFALGVRLLLVALFLPFSALDKILNFKGAVAQARQTVPSQALAVLLILAGLSVEIGMSTAILIGVADRLAALVLAAYCIATALMWKQFWKSGDYWTDPNGKARALFWDFWKNLALAGGFMLLTFGATAESADGFLAAPLSSTHPYAATSSPP
jgi:putative oxidoreductase